MEEKIEVLKAMHTIIKSMGDEDIYDAWIEHMPDEPDADDFKWLASDDEYIKDIGNTFVRLVRQDIKHGMWVDNVFVKG